MAKAIEQAHNFTQDKFREYREHILKALGMNLSDFDLDLNILSHSLHMKPTVLSVSVGEIINIHNLLVQMRNNL